MNGCLFVLYISIVSLFKVIVQIPGAKNLEVQIPLVISTDGHGSHRFNMSRRYVVDTRLLHPTFTLPDVAEGMVQS